MQHERSESTCNSQSLVAWLLAPTLVFSFVASLLALARSPQRPHLHKGAHNKDLRETRLRHLEQAADPLVDVRELEVGGGGEVAVKRPLVVVDDDAGHGHHGDTPVLALDGAVALELVGGRLGGGSEGLGLEGRRIR